jgi:pectinesterase
VDIDNRGFPSWINEEDNKMLRGNRVTPDVVVATDGSGHYRNVMEAVLAAPDYSNKRYVIHVKKGVYAEYVVIHPKKQNIMIIGDGIDSTVITGNRNKIDGWSTFRSATFGKFLLSSSYYYYL